MNLISILENLMAEAVFGAAVLLAGYVLIRRQNRSLARLLGATGDRRILLVLPHLHIRPGGVETDGGHPGVITEPVVTRCEFEAAIALRDALTDPLLRLLGRPRLGSGSVHLGESGPVEGTRFSPPRSALHKALECSRFVDLPTDIADRSLVLFGGPIYNPLAEVALAHRQCQVTATTSADHEWTARFCEGPRAGEIERSGDQPEGRELAIIQSYVLDGGQGPTITTCAGTSEAATLASVMFLLANWKRILRRCRSRSFAIVLAVGDDASGSTRCISCMVDGKQFTP